MEFLGLWEELSNEKFNSAEFRRIKSEAPKKSFTMTPSQWCNRINAKGIIHSKGKYSTGTFAHLDIALEFASWIDNCNYNSSNKKEEIKLEYKMSIRDSMEDDGALYKGEYISDISKYINEVGKSYRIEIYIEEKDKTTVIIFYLHKKKELEDYLSK